ncbi:MAG: succinylglutamate desuccinylase/aspartoacylase family protein [Trueperaceae bacterium]|nr:MAG: succinylglutamate desuccinylase/aspartoacylase family protein [Trueperaceae bacterium]
MGKTLQIGPLSVPAGGKAFGYLPVTTLASGAELGVPVHVVAGDEPGPGLALVVGLHGHEYSAINILREVLQSVDPARLRGHLIMVPMANPVAFEYGSKSTWIDGLYGGPGDLNRSWPGSPDGWLTERLAHAMAHEVFPHIDVVIDFHGEALGARNRNYYGYVLKTTAEAMSNERLEELAVNFGMEVLIERHVEPGPGSMTSFAFSQGVYVIGAEISDFYGLELPEGGRSLPGVRTLTETGVTGVENTMKLLGMIEGEPELPAVQARLRGMAGVGPRHGGLLIPAYSPADLGRLFPSGTALGTVISANSFEQLDVLRMPYERGMLVMVKGDLPFVHVNPGAGDFGSYVADAEGMVWIRR